VKQLTIAAFILGGMATDGAAAAPPKGDAEKGKQIVSQICVACHGLDGNGTEPTNPEFPKIAGKQTEYFLKQLRDFKTGKRKSEIMSGIVAGLSPDDMTNLAAYFANQKSRPGAAKNPELVEAGKRFYAERFCGIMPCQEHVNLSFLCKVISCHIIMMEKQKYQPYHYHKKKLYLIIRNLQKIS